MTSFDILCFGNQWDPIKMYAVKHVIKRLSNKGNVLWVNQLPLQLPRIAGLISNKTIKNKIINKIKSHSKILRNYENIWVLTPFYFPIYGNKFFDYINKRLFRLQVILSANRVLKPGHIIYATATYAVLDVIDMARGNKFIFHYADMISSLRGISEDKRREFRQKDAKIIELSDIVLCATKAIMNGLENMFPLRGKLQYFPHGVDSKLFETARNNPRKINEMEKIKRPIIGYFGSLTDANDKEALEYCAKKKPQWSFVLIGGPILGDYSMFEKYPNVYFLGKKRYQEIPYYGMYFDVGLLNWRPHEWIKHCYPVKSLEYLSLGLPIVSTPINEIKNNFSEFVAFARSPEEYLYSIEECIKTDSYEKKMARIERVKNETWDSRVNDLRKWIKEL